jgi:hypothetical protein
MASPSIAANNINFLNFPLLYTIFSQQQINLHITRKWKGIATPVRRAENPPYGASIGPTPTVCCEDGKSGVF